MHTLWEPALMACGALMRKVVDMLNSLYTIYDTLEEAQMYMIYKVQTIGDVYMCAGGVPYSSDAADKM